MAFRDDSRAVVIQIGAILIFAMLFMAFTMYQANVVPGQNKNVEISHSERVVEDMGLVQDRVYSTASTGLMMSTSFQLAPQYPDRLLAINPIRPSPQLEMSEERQISLKVNHSGGTDTYELTTQDLVYRSDYNEYTGAADVRYGMAGVYSEFEYTDIVRSPAPLLGDDEMTLILRRGDYHDSGSSSTVNLYASEEPTTYKVKNITATIETNLDEEGWNEILPDGTEWEHNGDTVTVRTDVDRLTAGVIGVGEDVDTNETDLDGLEEVNSNSDKETSNSADEDVVFNQDSWSVKTGETKEITGTVSAGDRGYEGPWEGRLDGVIVRDDNLIIASTNSEAVSYVVNSSDLAAGEEYPLRMRTENDETLAVLEVLEASAVLLQSVEADAKVTGQGKIKEVTVNWEADGSADIQILIEDADTGEQLTNETIKNASATDERTYTTGSGNSRPDRIKITVTADDSDTCSGVAESGQPTELC